MSEEKLYSLLEMVEGKEYSEYSEGATRYKIVDRVLYYYQGSVKEWRRETDSWCPNSVIFKEIKPKRKLVMYRHWVLKYGRLVYEDTDIPRELWAKALLLGEKLLETEVIKEIEVDDVH